MGNFDAGRLVTDWFRGAGEGAYYVREYLRRASHLRWRGIEERGWTDFLPINEVGRKMVPIGGGGVDVGMRDTGATIRP